MNSNKIKQVSDLHTSMNPNDLFVYVLLIKINNPKTFYSNGRNLPSISNEQEI